MRAEPVRGEKFSRRREVRRRANCWFHVSQLGYREHPSAMGLSRVELGDCFSGNALQTATWTGLVHTVNVSVVTPTHKGCEQAVRPSDRQTVRRSRSRGRAAASRRRVYLPVGVIWSCCSPAARKPAGRAIAIKSAAGVPAAALEAADHRSAAWTCCIAGTNKLQYPVFFVPCWAVRPPVCASA
jgi:hypothetical protein